MSYSGNSDPDRIESAPGRCGRENVGPGPTQFIIARAQQERCQCNETTKP